MAKISHEVKQYNLELVTADSQGMGILLIIIPHPHSFSHSNHPTNQPSGLLMLQCTTGHHELEYCTRSHKWLIGVKHWQSSPELSVPCHCVEWSIPDIPINSTEKDQTWIWSRQWGVLVNSMASVFVHVHGGKYYQYDFAWPSEL